MKTTLAILIAGILMLTTPMLALAYGEGQHDRRANQNHYSGWVKDHHDPRHGDWKDHRDHHRPYRYERNRYDRHHDHYEQRGYAVLAPLPILLPPRVLIHLGW